MHRDLVMAEAPPPTDPRQLPTRDYLLLQMVRAVKTSIVFTPLLFGTVAVNEALHSLVRVKPKWVSAALAAPLRAAVTPLTPCAAERSARPSSRR